MAEYIDKNPYPYSDKETNLEWNFEDRTEVGIPRDKIEGNEQVNEAARLSFDNAWVSSRAYPGKFMEHKYPHISIWDRTGELTLKQGYFYRVFRCRITKLTAEQLSLAMFIDCNIDLVTKLPADAEIDVPKEKRSKMIFTNCRLPFVNECKNYFMSFEGNTFLDEFTTTESCELLFNMTKKWICSYGINNLKEIKKSKVVVRSARWISGDNHTSNFKMVEDCEISNFGTDMVGRCNNHTGVSRSSYMGASHNVSEGTSVVGGFDGVSPRNMSRLSESPSLADKEGDRVDKESILPNSDSTVAEQGATPLHWYDPDKSWDIYAETEASTSSNSLYGWEGDGICAEKTVETASESSYILLDGKYKATESNYENMDKCTMIALDSDIKSDNGWNYKATNSIIGSSGTIHKADSGKDQLETEKCLIGIIKSEFEGPVPHTFNNTEDVIHMLTTKITNNSGVGRLGTKSLYEEYKNNIDVKLDVSTMTECLITDSESIHRSADANCYTVEDSRLKTQKMTLDPKINSFKLTNTNATDTKSNLKGLKEIEIENTIFKLDDPTLEGEKIVSASQSVLTTSNSSDLMSTELNSTTYDFQNSKTKELTISGQSTGRLFKIEVEELILNNASGEFTGCKITNLTGNNSTIDIRRATKLEKANLNFSTYDFQDAVVNELTLSNKSNGRLFKIEADSVNIDKSSGELSGCIVAAINVNESSLLINSSSSGSLNATKSDIKILQSTASISADDGSRIEASNCGGSIDTPVGTKSLSSDMTCLVSGNLVNYVNKKLEEHVKEDISIKTDANYSSEIEGNLSNKASNISESATLGHSITAATINESATGDIINSSLGIHSTIAREIVHMEI